jgi:serine protease Do
VNAALLAAVLALAPRTGTEGAFERIKGSLFTIEIHSGKEDAKNALGSGYLISRDGLVVTNYHVVGSYVEEPDRYRIRARNHTGDYAATLVGFDLENDLALLRVSGVPSPPLPLAAALPPPASPVTAYGNPHGLGLSLIEGIFNGFAEKGVVERMLLSMPLNSGMSGGPILNPAGEVIGTNVSVMWDSDSLSFGVPVTKIAALRAAAPLTLEPAVLREEVTRQLAAVEAATEARAVAPFAEAGRLSRVSVGAVETLKPPDVFACWDDTEEYKDQGITKSRYGCDLQFTPSVERLGEVGAVEILVEHFTSVTSRYGFYASLEAHGPTHLEAAARAPENGVWSAPQCVSERVRVGDLVWHVNTCLAAYVRQPGFFDFDMVATTLTRGREAAYVALHMKAFKPASYDRLARALLEGARWRP